MDGDSPKKSCLKKFPLIALVAQSQLDDSALFYDWLQLEFYVVFNTENLYILFCGCILILGNEFWLTLMAYGLKFNTTQFSTSSSDAVHRHRMMESLAYRLSVAQAAQDIQLIERLEQEGRQLEANVRGPEVSQLFTSWLKVIRQGVNRLFEDRSMLRACEFRCGSDRWLYAFDPITEEFLYADSEVELEALMGTIYKR